jgi:hypothetical protein
VKGITDCIGEIVPFMPIMINATLLSFKDSIIYDGFFSSYPMQFGSRYNNTSNEIYKKAKLNKKLITAF